MAGTKRSCCNRFCCFSSSASDEEGQDHPASAGPRSLPSAIDNTTEALPGAPKRTEAPIPGSSNVVTPRREMAGTKRSCCNRFCCFSSSASDEEGQDHPASAGPRSLPSAIDNTTETLPGPPKRSEAPIPASSNVVTPRKDEIEQHVDPNLDVSRTHQCDKAPLSESQNILRKSEGEDVNAHPNTQCDEPSSSGSSNVPVKSEGEHVDVSPNVSEAETLPGPPKRSEAPIPGSSNLPVDPNLDVSGTNQCDKAPLSESQNILRKSEGEYSNAHPNFSGPTQCEEPSSSGSSNLPVKSEGEHVDVNPKVSEPPSSSSSTCVTKSGLFSSIKHIDQADGKKVDVNLDQLVDHISELLKLREEEMLPNKKASNPSNFRWPEGLKKLNAILSFGTDLKNFTELLSKGLDFASTLKDVISGPVTTILKAIGQASVVTAGLLVVVYTLERFHDLSDNKNGCWVLIKEMSRLASVVKGLNESGKGTFNVIEEATTLVVEGAITCCTQLGHSDWKSFLLASKGKADLSGITQKLNSMYLKISVDISIRNLSAIERVLAAMEANRNPPVSRIYPDYAVGIEESIAEVLSLLECESAQNAVTVILHGFGGTGKTTLADAVFSQVREYRYSHVQLFEDIDSKPNITELQKKILKDLMGPEEPVPDIRKYQDGQRELGERLEKMEAFIYIDNVLEGAALKQLLPVDMSWAKKVRLLLTARNEDVKNACPKQCTQPKIYQMQKIQRQAALLILKREIKDGVNDSQFNDIIDTCGGIPLMLTLAAPFIGRALNKQAAFSTMVSHTYPRHAVGIEKPIEQVFSHLEIQSDDQNAVTVILHGFGGMGKTTLADAVFSEIGGVGMVKTTRKDADFWNSRGGKRSKVRLFDGIKSTPDITALQKQILEDLMEPGETPPEIRTHKDGQQALEGVLRKIHAFIYIDNVLEAAALEELLPQDMTTAKKVRLLLTARDENVKNACPRSRTEPKFYNMQKIHDPEAMVILKREIEEGVTETQFSDIIQICGGIPLMLTLAAAFIRRADSKEEAYDTLMEQKDKWASEDFKEMRYAFAYDALPQLCKDPFLDICTYFNGWNWDIVKDIVGDDALIMLKSRALVTRTTNGFASVHDVILALARGMSKEESKDKEVRCKFTNASELKKFLEEGDTEGITGIWLTERKDVPKEEDVDDRKIVVQASALDKMHKSLRVLQLGNSIKVEGNCNEIFKELVFFEAKISQLPFDDVSQLPQLRYLSYDPPNWVPSSLPSSLAIMNFNGKTFQTYK